MAARFASALWKVLTPARISGFAKSESPTETRTDAEPPEDLDDDASDLLHELRDAAARSFDEATFVSASETTAERTHKHSITEFARLGIKVQKEPTFKSLIKGWTRDNVERVKGLQLDQIDKLDTLLREGFGRRFESLAKDIEDQVDGVALSRAEAIARDSVLTLNGQITKERQVAADITEFIWTTSNDERVRDDHAVLEGQRFSWDDPPDVGIPGEDFNCRCTAYPVLPELEAEGLE